MIFIGFCDIAHTEAYCLPEIYGATHDYMHDNGPAIVKFSGCEINLVKRKYSFECSI